MPRRVRFQAAIPPAAPLPDGRIAVLPAYGGDFELREYPVPDPEPGPGHSAP